MFEGHRGYFQILPAWDLLLLFSLRCFLDSVITAASGPLSLQSTKQIILIFIPITGILSLPLLVSFLLRSDLSALYTRLKDSSEAVKKAAEDQTCSNQRSTKPGRTSGSWCMKTSQKESSISQQWLRYDQREQLSLKPRMNRHYDFNTFQNCPNFIWFYSAGQSKVEAETSGRRQVT